MRLRVDDELLRPALELAFRVAALGSKQRPAVPAPAGLRRFVRFQRPSPAALDAALEAVEGDDEFRRRVAGAATVETVGEIGLLWLERQEGWQDRVRTLQGALAAGATADEDAGTGARRAERRREAAEAAAQRAAAELAGVRDALSRERARRVEAETRVGELQARVDALAVELRAAERARARAEGAAVEAVEARRGAEARLAELGAQLEQALAARDAALADRAASGAGRASPMVDAERVAAALRSAAVGAEQLAGSLADVARALTTRRPGPVPEPRPVRAGRSPDRRKPLAVPGGLYGDSVQMAEHLVRQPGLLLVVDGYNVAKLGWPELPLEDQRTSLLDLLDDLVRRTHVQAVVVFDGAAVVAPSAKRRLVRVRFSPPGVTADDVVCDEVAALDPATPVAVATNDRELQRRVRSEGANVVASEQLLALGRR